MTPTGALTIGDGGGDLSIVSSKSVLSTMHIRLYPLRFDSVKQAQQQLEDLSAIGVAH